MIYNSGDKILLSYSVLLGLLNSCVSLIDLRLNYIQRYEDKPAYVHTIRDFG